MKEHIIANSFDIKLPGDTPRERESGTFMLNDFCCFSSKFIFASFPQPRTRQRKKTKLNKENSFDIKLPRGSPEDQAAWKFYVERLVVFLLHL